MVTTDERVRLVDGFNLEISELEPQDAGDYVCQIADKQTKDQVHTVEILGKYYIAFMISIWSQTKQIIILFIIHSFHALTQVSTIINIYETR